MAMMLFPKGKNGPIFIYIDPLGIHINFLFPCTIVTLSWMKANFENVNSNRRLPPPRRGPFSSDDAKDK
jgi:hypothetical protein